MLDAGYSSCEGKQP
jgi:hypothetical protein